MVDRHHCDEWALHKHMYHGDVRQMRLKRSFANGGYIIGFLCAALLLVLTVNAPEADGSNAAAWFRIIGLSSLGESFTKSADNWIAAFLVAAFLVCTLPPLIHAVKTNKLISIAGDEEMSRSDNRVYAEKPAGEILRSIVGSTRAEAEQVTAQQLGKWLKVHSDIHDIRKKNGFHYVRLGHLFETNPILRFSGEIRGGAN